jgi:hypothetical protein
MFLLATDSFPVENFTFATVVSAVLKQVNVLNATESAMSGPVVFKIGSTVLVLEL